MIFRIMVFVIAVMFTVSIANAQPGVHTAKTGSEVLDLIRKEKIDLILPGAMRDNNVDMWIQVTRQGDQDPMFPEFGSTSGYMIFTDLGDRIERASFSGGFGGAGALDFDIYGSLALSRAITGYDYNTQDLSIYNEITEFVTERDPKTIAVNYSDWLAIADGISYTQYLKLEKILGPKYSKRIVSAENVITDFRSRRILREVTLMTNALEIHRQILERAFSIEVITPGVTTLGEVGWWVKEEFFNRGLTRGFGTKINIPGVLYSAVSDLSKTGSSDYVIQRGDFLQFDNMVRYLDYFWTDFKRNAYIMRKGETNVPKGIQHAFDRALEARKIIRKHIEVGKTAGETLRDIVLALEKSDYLYSPSNDIGSEDYKIIQKLLANTDKSGFSIDLHSQGNRSDWGSLEPVGPSVSPFRSDRDHLTIQENHIFALEFTVFTNLPERPGFPLFTNIEGIHIVSSRGVEFLHPPNEQILVIH